MDYVRGLLLCDDKPSPFSTTPVFAGSKERPPIILKSPPPPHRLGFNCVPPSISSSSSSMQSVSFSSLHPHRHRRQPFPPSPGLRSTLRTAVNFLPPSSSSSSIFHGADAHRRSPSSSDLLPVVVRKSGRAYRYKWDGVRLALVPCGCQGFESARVWDRFGELLRLFCSALRGLFVPHKVQPNYLLYLKWKLLHRIFSSALHVLATQVRKVASSFSFLFFLF